MEARRNALRAQRDKILSRKRKERELQLQKQEQVERLATEKGKYQKLEFKNELFFFSILINFFSYRIWWTTST